MRNKFYARAWSILRPLVMFFLPVELRGTENLGDEAAILCANHSSAWDPILLVLAMPQNFNVRIMAKKQLFSIPVVRWFLRNIGVFPVDRGNSDINAVKTAITSLRDGWNLLIFPEGTVIRDGIGKADGLPAHAHSGAAMIGVRTGAVFMPVFLDGKKRLFHKTRIIIGKPYTPVYTGRRGTAEEMQNIADDLLREIYALGGQQVGGAPL